MSKISIIVKNWNHCFHDCGDQVRSHRTHAHAHARARTIATPTRLKVGDVVSAAVGAFGEEYARFRGARPWTTEEVRDDGVVTSKSGNLWLVDFNDGNGTVGLARKALHFVSRT
eukprot:4039697-Pleurochrysis_carterae.AAC.2